MTESHGTSPAAAFLPFVANSTSPVSYLTAPPLIPSRGGGEAEDPPFQPRVLFHWQSPSARTSGGTSTKPPASVSEGTTDSRFHMPRKSTKRVPSRASTTRASVHTTLLPGSPTASVVDLASRSPILITSSAVGARIASMTRPPTLAFTPEASRACVTPSFPDEGLKEQMARQLEELHKGFSEGQYDAEEYHNLILQIVLQIHQLSTAKAMPGLVALTPVPTPQHAGSTTGIAQSGGDLRQLQQVVTPLIYLSPAKNGQPAQLVPARVAIPENEPASPSIVGNLQFYGPGAGMTTTTTSTINVSSTTKGPRDVALTSTRDQVTRSRSPSASQPEKSDASATRLISGVSPLEALVLLMVHVEVPKKRITHEQLTVLIMAILPDIADELARKVRDDHIPTDSPLLAAMIAHGAVARSGAILLGVFAHRLYKILKTEHITGLKTKRNRLRLLASEAATRRWNGRKLLAFVAGVLDAIARNIDLVEQVSLVSAIVDKLTSEAASGGSAALLLLQGMLLVFPELHNIARHRVGTILASVRGNTTSLLEFSDGVLCHRSHHKPRVLRLFAGLKSTERCLRAETVIRESKELNAISPFICELPPSITATPLKPQESAPTVVTASRDIPRTSLRAHHKIRLTRPVDIESSSMKKRVQPVAPTAALSVVTTPVIVVKADEEVDEDDDVEASGEDVTPDPEMGLMTEITTRRFEISSSSSSPAPSPEKKRIGRHRAANGMSQQPTMSMRAAKAPAKEIEKVAAIESITQWESDSDFAPPVKRNGRDSPISHTQQGVVPRITAESHHHEANTVPSTGLTGSRLPLSSTSDSHSRSQSFLSPEAAKTPSSPPWSQVASPPRPATRDPAAPKLVTLTTQPKRDSGLGTAIVEIGRSAIIIDTSSDSELDDAGIRPLRISAPVRENAAAPSHHEASQMPQRDPSSFTTTPRSKIAVGGKTRIATSDSSYSTAAGSKPIPGEYLAAPVSPLGGAPRPLVLAQSSSSERSDPTAGPRPPSSQTLHAPVIVTPSARKLSITSSSSSELVRSSAAPNVSQKEEEEKKGSTAAPRNVSEYNKAAVVLENVTITGRKRGSGSVSKEPAIDRVGEGAADPMGPSDCVANREREKESYQEDRAMSETEISSISNLSSDEERHIGVTADERAAPPTAQVAQQVSGVVDVADDYSSIDSSGIDVDDDQDSERSRDIIIRSVAQSGHAGSAPDPRSSLGQSPAPQLPPGLLQQLSSSHQDSSLVSHDESDLVRQSAASPPPVNARVPGFSRDEKSGPRGGNLASPMPREQQPTGRREGRYQVHDTNTPSSQPNVRKSAATETKTVTSPMRQVRGNSPAADTRPSTQQQFISRSLLVKPSSQHEESKRIMQSLTVSSKGNFAASLAGRRSRAFATETEKKAVMRF